MSAVKEFIAKFNEEYHHWDEAGAGADRSLDPVGAPADRSGSVRDLPGLIAAYHLEGIQGIGEWFERMAQYYTEPVGNPLPCDAELQNITGIKTDEAVAWLTANGAGLIENGTEAALLSFLKENQQAYRYALVLGAIWGFSHENPLVTGVNALLYLRKLKKEGRLQESFRGKVDRFARASYGVVDKVCVGAFLADLSFRVLGTKLAAIIGQSIDWLSFGAGLADTAQSAAEIASAAADLADGAASLGMGFLASKLVKKGFERLNAEVKRELEKIFHLAAYKKQFKALIDKNAPPESLMPVIELMEENGIYQPLL